MKSIDAEIQEVEERLSRRKTALRHSARVAKARTAKAMVSPLTLIGAVGIGFLVAGRLARGKKKRAQPALSQETKEQGKGFALGTLLMTAATWLVRSQFGGPVGLAQFVLSKVRASRSPATGVPAGFPPRVPR